MEKLDTMKLADDLALLQDKVLGKEQSFNADAVYKIIDGLGVLDKPIKDYFNMTEDQYYESESDHKLTLVNLSEKLTDLHDRILTNHVDGYVDKDQIHLTYNHENPYEDDFYNPEVDYHVITYSLKVIGAVQSVAAKDLQGVLSKDAVLSLGLATYALANNAQFYIVGNGCRLFLYLRGVIMKIFKQARGFADKFLGAKRRASLEPSNENLDPMQKYTTVGEYHVGKSEGTPGGQPYELTVYKDEKDILHQALSLESSQNLAPEYVRQFNKKLGRFRAFKNRETGRRYQVEKYLDGFVERVKNRVRKGEDSINISVITDTHYKYRDSTDFYGWNGLTHVNEFSYLDDSGLLDLKVHLGDWIDGSDTGFVSEGELMRLREAFKSNNVPYIMLKGNHDENDKFDEHHDSRASFPENEFENIMWPSMYEQARVHYLSRQHGVCYYDFDDLRFISVNTSDLPYILDSKGQKKYDAKLTLAVREDQIEEIIEILEKSSGKKIIFLSHANPINRKGSNALKYNGRSLHELLVAFNQGEKGRMHSSVGVPPEFRLANDFDFTHIKDARIVAYFCGHRHREDQYRINGIQYILFNCSALMGPNHVLTTKYNKNWHREIDSATEFAGYIVNIDLKKHIIQAFGYGAASKRRIFFIQLNQCKAVW